MSRKVAIVTGASSGIGAAIAAALAKAGCNVVATYGGNQDGGEATATICKSEGVEAITVKADISSDEDCRAVAQAALDKWGRIDVLVNNAGTVSDQPLVDTSEDNWKRVIETNLTGCWLMTQTVANRMIATNTAGRIVNISSILGTTPVGQIHAYSASKAGINQLTRTSAIELARHGISVNAIAPGYIETDLNRDFLKGPVGDRITKRIPHRRFGRLAELEGVLILLTSPAGAYMTGEIVTVDGGLSLSGM